MENTIKSTFASGMYSHGEFSPKTT